MVNFWCPQQYDDRVVSFWYPWQYVPTMELAALLALGFVLGTCCAHGLGLPPRDSLRLRPGALPLRLTVLLALALPLGLAALVKHFLFITPTTQPPCETQPYLLGQPDATLTIGAAERNPNYRGNCVQP